MPALFAGLGALGAHACAPAVGTDPVPEVMEMDPAASPPRAPEPTHVLLNPGTGLVDFALLGIAVPADCSAQGAMPQAQCEFYRYLQSLDGFPTVAPARAPASAALDLGTATVPDNVVVVDQGRGVVPGVRVGWSDRDRYLTVTARRGWDVGRLYVVGVRGYQRGVRAASGKRVVGSVLQLLLAQDRSLTCDAPSAAEIAPGCPFFRLLGRQMTPDGAAKSLFQLEALRRSYADLGAWAALGAAGLAKDETAVLWAFPTHRASVVELDPGSGAVPIVVGGGELRLGVKGTVDGATVTAFSVGRPGSVYLMDLTQVAAGDLEKGLPPFDATYEGGEIALRTREPLQPRHTYGILMTRGLTNAAGVPLVPSPITVLLSARGELVDATGHSNVSGVSDADARELEGGRTQFGALFDNPLIRALTGLRREDLVYLYAFPYLP